MSQPLDKSASRAAPLPAVLQSVKHDTRKLLAERLEALFHSADDALFEMADRAATDVDQNLYFDSMRIVRLQRASIQQKYIDAYSRSWSCVMSGEAPASSKPTLSLDADDFSLLANDELEISVAAAGISSKVTTKFLLPITQLTKRLEAVCEHNLPPELNPLGPQSLNQNFIAAIESLDVHIKVLIILLKLFERFVAEELAPVYDRANEILIDAGVLPELKHRVQKAPVAEHSRANSASSCEPADSGQNNPAQLTETNHSPQYQQASPHPGSAYSQTGPASLVPETTPEFYRLQTLLESARDHGHLRASVARNALPANSDALSKAQNSTTSGSPSPSGAYASEDHGDATLVSTVQLMEVLGAVQGSVSAEPINLSQPAAPIDFRQLLITNAPEVTGSQDTRLEKQSDDVVDLVKMLFDYILNDHNLAIPMKALIGRLQIPVLKVAIMDQTFFAKPSHPARQLLNELAAAGIGWSSASELKRDETYNKIESIVLRVMNGFTEDLTLFSNLIAELRHFVKKEKKKRNQVEQRVKETEAGKAKTREAKKTVQTLINQKACGLRLPAISGRFVSDSWSKVLVYLFVTRGTDSEDWVESIETLDDLLWATQPLTNDDDVAAREAMLPGLLTKLESGITLANLPEAQEQLNALRSTVEEIHATDLDYLDSAAQELSADAAHFDAQADGPASDSATTTKANALELPEQPELILVQEADAPPEELENLADPQFVEQIITLSEGQWVELRDNGGALIRCKLATIVQPGNRYVFVNRKGMKVCERSRNALALALEAEQMNLLDESEMFDRALESVIGNLQRMHDSNR